MPSAAPRPCSHPGCGVLVRDGSGRCVKHPKKSFSTAGKPQGSRHERGYGTAWEKLRAVIMLRDMYLCKPCGDSGRLTPAHAVDHIVPKAALGTDESDNLQAICKECHKRKTAVEAAMQGGPAASEPKWLKPARIPVTVVVGPPGSGKSTYIKKHAGANDLVLDLDFIAADLFKTPVYAATMTQMMVAMRYRNAMLSSLSSSDVTYVKAWVAASAGSPLKRAYWRDHFKANVVQMETSKDDCVQRVMADDRRDNETRMRNIKTIAEWR